MKMTPDNEYSISDTPPDRPRQLCLKAANWQLFQHGAERPSPTVGVAIRYCELDTQDLNFDALEGSMANWAHHRAIEAGEYLRA
jgi:hypothetical protein